MRAVCQSRFVVRYNTLKGMRKRFPSLGTYGWNIWRSATMKVLVLVIIRASRISDIPLSGLNLRNHLYINVLSLPLSLFLFNNSSVVPPIAIADRIKIWSLTILMRTFKLYYNFVILYT